MGYKGYNIKIFFLLILAILIKTPFDSDFKIVPTPFDSDFKIVPLRIL